MTKEQIILKEGDQIVTYSIGGEPIASRPVEEVAAENRDVYQMILILAQAEAEAASREARQRGGNGTGQNIF